MSQRSVTERGIVEFFDVLHGPFKLGIGENSQLVQDLLDSPELQRLRHMRQMNFDVPNIQELGTSKRLPHSVGVAYLSEKLSYQWLSSPKDRKVLVVAALLHDAAIPPYGHLVENHLKKKHKNFNHELILDELIKGKYDKLNIHHQLLPGRTLQVHYILNKHKVDQEKVLNLVRPAKGKHSALSADIDLDNIDNVHRMAVLMGWDGVKENLNELIAKTQLDQNINLIFEHSAIKAIEKWQEFRQRMYTLIIGHPLCVSHNAFQSKLVQNAIEHDIITPENWYIVEPKFEENLRNNAELKEMGEQIITGPRYALIDYVWFQSYGQVPRQDWTDMEELLRPKLPELGTNQDYFFWIEKKLICRSVTLKTTEGIYRNLGQDSVSLFIAKVHTDSDTTGWHRDKRVNERNWRKSVEQTVGGFLTSWNFIKAYPEDYDGNYFGSSKRTQQLELC